MTRPTRAGMLSRLNEIKSLLDRTGPTFDGGVCHPLLDQLRMLRDVLADTIEVVETYEPISNEEEPCSRDDTKSPSA